MIFKLLFYSIRNYSPNIPITPLGRWNRNCNVDSSTFLTNRDHCGDQICGNIKFTKRYLEEVFKEKKLKRIINKTLFQNI